MSDDRRTELARRLGDVEQRLTRACAAAGRARSEVTLIAVTKAFPASDVRLLAELGVRDIGENRDQEAREKAEQLADVSLHWHFVGQLQTNKCRSIAQYADSVHSVDRDRVAGALTLGASEAGRAVDAFIQVALDDGPGRGGATPDAVPALADRIAASETLRLAGVMAIAPLGTAPAPAFARLAEVAAIVRAAHPDATGISAGMSADLEAAVAAGATHVRIGTALLGGRRLVVR